MFDDKNLRECEVLYFSEKNNEFWGKVTGWFYREGWIKKKYFAGYLIPVSKYIPIYFLLFFCFVSVKHHENKVNQLTVFWMVCFLIKEVQNAARFEHFRTTYLEVIALVTCRVRKCQWSIPELSRLSVSKDFDSPPQRTVSLTITNPFAWGGTCPTYLTVHIERAEHLSWKFRREQQNRNKVWKMSTCQHLPTVQSPSGLRSFRKMWSLCCHLNSLWQKKKKKTLCCTEILLKLQRAEISDSQTKRILKEFTTHHFAISQLTLSGLCIGRPGNCITIYFVDWHSNSIITQGFVLIQ